MRENVIEINVDRPRGNFSIGSLEGIDRQFSGHNVRNLVQPC